jgi:UDP-2,4-diacetamido-2,4,6-trideoxy-beta-L-altropyranose hydrolase
MNLLFRTDASVAIGTGHVMRCLALAQAWQDARQDEGRRAVFAMAEATQAIQVRLVAESCEVISVSCATGTPEDSVQTIALARTTNAEWIVVDGYRFTAEYQRTLRDAGLKVLFLDDYGHAEHYYADIVLNQNVSASAELYASRELHTRLLLGPRYCLLRREFEAWHDWKREVSPVCRRLLVMMGGSDAGNLTARVIEAVALARVENLETTVVVGGSSPHLATLEGLAAQLQQKVTIRRDVANIPELMATADVAVSAAGSTCWELCRLGLPALLLDVAANQTAVARELDRVGCAFHVGDQTTSVEMMADQLKRLVDDYDLRRSLAMRSRQLVDGQGATRVVSILRRADFGSTDGTLRLRSAAAGDARLLFEWANDPEVRAASFSSAPIPWETHSAWFEKKLGSVGSYMLIAEAMGADGRGIPCGQIRFDVRPDGEWEVDVSVAKIIRGHGLASRLIALGVQRLRQIHRDASVHAFIKPANTASVKVFERAGFVRRGDAQIQGHAAIHLVSKTEVPKQ